MSRRRSTLAMSCLAHAVQDGMSATIYVLLPVLAQSLGLNLSEVGLFKGLKGFAQGMLEVVSGFLSERFGSKPLLVVGLLCSGAGYMLFSAAAGPVLVMICLIIVGIGTALQHAPSSSLVSAAYVDGGRRGALGLYNSSGDAGKLVFSGLFSLTIGAGLAWSFTTFAFGLIAAIAGLVVLRVLKTAARTPETDDASSPADAVRGWGIMDRTGFSALLIVTSLDNLVQAAAATFVAFLMLEKGIPLSIAVFAAPVTLIGGMFGKAACGFLADRIGPRAAYTLVQILTALGFAGVVMTPGLASFAVLPFLGVFLQGSSSITYSMVNDFVHPDRVSRGFALMYGMGSLATVVGPFATGVIGDTYDVGTAMYVLAAVSILAIIPCIWMKVGSKAAAQTA